jgi:hypothetical protein
MKKEKSKKPFYIKYYSEKDSKVIKRPYDPHYERQHEFIAKGTGNLCKRYWDQKKNGWRTAKCGWKIISAK